jgi:hypothetical protein
MIGNRPVLIFDTSAYNRMLEDGVRADDIMAALRAAYFVRIADLCVGEVCATRDRSKRKAIMEWVNKSQAGPGDYLLPQNEILRLLIAAYEQDFLGFDWRAVNVSSVGCAREIARGNFINDDALAEAQFRSLKDSRKEFEGVWSHLRPKLMEVVRRHGRAAPIQLDEVLPMVEAEGGLLWSFGQGLYSRVAAGDTSESTVRNFMERCPPFRAVAYAYLLAWFDRSLADRQKRDKYTAGRIDLFMSIYLPYCDQFISAEVRGMQETCLREIARIARLATKVRAYDDFCDSMTLAV